MRSRILLPVLIICFAAVCLVCGCGSGGDRDSRFSSHNDPLPAETIREAAAGRNVLILVLDAAAAGHFGCYGYNRDTTPFIDELAAESVVFDNAYAQASGTMLSVFSYFTSRYPIFGDEVRVDENAILTVHPSLTTLAEYLGRGLPRSLAYTSNTWLQRRFGHAQGFGEFWTLRELTEDRLPADAKDLDAVPLCLQWMKQNADAGFFAYLHLMKPHTPYDPPESFVGRFADHPIDPRIGSHDFIQGLQGRRPDEQTVGDMVDLYDANLACVDEAVGDLIAELKAAGIWDDTVLVLTADHGQSLFEYGKPHGHGGTICENALRVPLLIRIPGVPGLAARRIAEPVELVDLTPTLVDLAGVEEPGDVFAGMSLTPLIAGQPVDAELMGPDRIIHSRTNRLDPAVFTVMRRGYKLTLGEQADAGELFDITADPGESRDLLADDPDSPEGEELLAYLRTWLGTGNRLGSGAGSVPLDVLDEKDIRRLRSLGYVR